MVSLYLTHVLVFFVQLLVSNHRIGVGWGGTFMLYQGRHKFLIQAKNPYTLLSSFAPHQFYASRLTIYDSNYKALSLFISCFLEQSAQYLEPFFFFPRSQEQTDSASAHLTPQFGLRKQVSCWCLWGIAFRTNSEGVPVREVPGRA